MLILVLGFYFSKFAPKVISLNFLELTIIKGIGISEILKNASLGVVILITIFTLFKYKYKSVQRWFISILITATISRLFIMDIIINIKSLSWLPIFKLSYLTVIIASIIIILSLLIEDRSINE